jgi:gas vesicle protein
MKLDPIEAKIEEEAQRARNRNLFVGFSIGAISTFAFTLICVKQNGDSLQMLKKLREEIRNLEYDNWVASYFIDDVKHMGEEFTNFAAEYEPYR